VSGCDYFVISFKVFLI